MSFDFQAVPLMGISINRIAPLFTFAIGSALASAAGILYGLAYPVLTNPYMGVLLGWKAFVHCNFRRSWLHPRCSPGRISPWFYRNICGVDITVNLARRMWLPLPLFCSLLSALGHSSAAHSYQLRL